jgi:hypothetical protein
MAQNIRSTSPRSPVLFCLTIWFDFSGVFINWLYAARKIVVITRRIPGLACLWLHDTCAYCLLEGKVIGMSGLVSVASAMGELVGAG